MSEQEKVERAKKLKKGDKVKAKIGDYVIGFEDYEMEFESLDDQKSHVSLRHHISKCRYVPNGRIDNYLIPVNRLVF